MFEWQIGHLRLSVNVLFLASLLVLMLADGGELSLWCLLASLMHETGHVIAVLLLEHQPIQVSLGAFGMQLTRRETVSSGYVRQMLILLAGPAVNIGCAVLLFGCGKTGVAFGTHLVIGLFNLLPIEPLDGGQALFCALAGHGEIEKAERMVFFLSVVLLFFLVLLGFTVLLAGGYNFTLLAVGIYLCVLTFCHHKQE